VQPVELQYFGEQINLAGQINLGARVPEIQMQFEMPGLDVERFLKRVGGKGRIHGLLKLSGEFASEGASTEEIVKQLRGEFSIRGSGLVLKGFNLDKVLEEVKKVQGYGLLDFAALLTAGPMATLATQGFSKLDALYKIGEVQGDGRISQIVSDWKIANGVATAADVAFATLKQRVAVQGALDILNGRYRELTIADVDAKGCVITSETIDGPFEEAEIKETGILDRTVFRPLKKLLGPECQPFYVGAVAHPAAVQSQ